MNEPKQKSLLELYELLWEQIKDEEFVKPLPMITYEMLSIKTLSRYEEWILDRDIEINFKEQKDLHNNYASLSRKSFVQQQIEKLKNKE